MLISIIICEYIRTDHKIQDKNALRADLVGMSGLKKNFGGQEGFLKKGKKKQVFCDCIVTGKIVTGTARPPNRPKFQSYLLTIAHLVQAIVYWVWFGNF